VLHDPAGTAFSDLVRRLMLGGGRVPFQRKDVYCALPYRLALELFPDCLDAF
jgi:hypothetical protein